MHCELLVLRQVIQLCVLFENVGLWNVLETYFPIQNIGMSSVIAFFELIKHVWCVSLKWWKWLINWRIWMSRNGVRSWYLVVCRTDWSLYSEASWQHSSQEHIPSAFLMGKILKVLGPTDSIVVRNWIQWADFLLKFVLSYPLFQTFDCEQ